MVQQKESLTTQFDALQSHSPKPVAKYVPSNGAEQKRTFFRNETRNPNHQYNKLDAVDFKATSENVTQIGEEILDNPDLNPKFKDAYTEFIEKYHGALRSFRGTDELPWFKDLAYYNGSVNMWHYLESIRGDDIKFMFVLMGKADPANPTHQRLQYETATP